MVRTRNAPSPTGFPHIGTMYQSLFNWAFAKKYKGQFILRIEDTDRTRFVEGAEEGICNALDWFGLTENESPRKGGPYAPYRQSERLDIYKKHAQELIEKGHAYYCFCTKERLEEVRKKMQEEKKSPMYDKHCRNLSAEEVDTKLKENTPWVIRMKIPENQKIIVRDEIRGDIEFDSNIVDDQVLVKADGYPTYHLAVVVDDHLMKITHMLRGEEWISSAPKHFLLYEFFGWEKPLFFHTPLIRNPDKSKFSKRHGHTQVSWYQEQGYLPEAILNFMALLGWTHPEGKDIFSLDEFVQLFELKDLKAVGPIFDMKKLDWMNGEYLRNMEPEVLSIKLLQFIGKEYSPELVKKTIPLVQERMKKLSDYLLLAEFFFKKPEQYEIDLHDKKDLLKKVHDELEKVSDWKEEPLGTAMVAVAQRESVKNSEFFMMIRVAITGKKISPPLNESMELLGQEEVLQRLKKLS